MSAPGGREVIGNIQNYVQFGDHLSRDDATSGPKQFFPGSDGRFQFKIWKQAQSSMAQDDFVYPYNLASNPCPIDLMFHDAGRPALEGQMFAYKKVCP